ncbi:hydrogenase-4 component G [Campylobacter sp. RM13119]|uniref:hydrogenase-4 component G n=1 Tax=Campylobacter californiensis TaxID=1032243 RepID=UPI00147360EE|nr:hydrogenase-4 component G [Campylobacter sp. RM13119]MBE3606520.1 hydrogenase-4 component G [Campylobacter sp. RM13119]
MQVSLNSSILTTISEKTQTKQDTLLNKNNEEKLKEFSSMSAKELSNSYFLQFQAQISAQTTSNSSAQSALSGVISGVPSNLSEILSGLDLSSIGYNGTAIDKLNVDEASALVSEEGFFGITNTAQRLSGFVLSFAGDDLEKLQAAREGILRGFNEAQKACGGNLPEISQKTIDKALSSIDEKIASLGGNVLNVSA